MEYTRLGLYDSHAGAVSHPVGFSGNTCAFGDFLRGPAAVARYAHNLIKGKPKPIAATTRWRWVSR